MSEPRSRGGRPDRSRAENGARRRFVSRPKVCQFCADGIREPDYKDQRRLQRLVSDRGKIVPSRRSGTCASHQRSLTIAIKRARHLAILPFLTSGSLRG